MNRDDIIRMAQECYLIGVRPHLDGIYQESLERFAALVAAAEREAIADEFSQRLQSDLEHGVKSLNKAAWQRFATNYPELNEFSDWLAVRGEE